MSRKPYGPNAECETAECASRPHARGLCKKHYKVALKAGLPPQPTPQERFWAKVQQGDGGCWLWTGATSSGYGAVRWNGRREPAHRIAYELMVSDIPDGLILDHLCRNRPCVNPYHLDPVTVAVNNYRGFGWSGLNLRVMSCPQGHPYDDENTYARIDRNGRECRACSAERRAARATHNAA